METSVILLTFLTDPLDSDRTCINELINYDGYEKLKTHLLDEKEGLRAAV